MSSKDFNAFEMAQAQFDKVADILNLDDSTRQLLRNPLREYHFSIPVKMDDGSVKFLKGSEFSIMMHAVRQKVELDSIHRRLLIR